ncbi:amidohydrolase family protein [Solwaraspora sp. WMMD406]|uniref:amidohydrolase family protein n=1 Tax=Solwaraspora sp. WMMD406 TaxID=3016095 RepID=UPI0024177526|nr:amidohydrolase family protein [Solwaraspora sp. WMMD406]MDG4763524.1 amidohydrolase family protein [Solwaraspora sp. WMMD406]
MTIDVHGHLSPPESMRRFPMPRSLGDAETMIETKLAAGVDLTIIGSPVGAGAMVPLPGVDNYAQTEEELARFHDWLGELVARYPRHLRAYVYANPFGGDSHLEAVRERLAQDEFVGLIANSSVADRYLDQPEAADFFALAAEIDVPVLLHAPAAPAAGTGLADLMTVEQLGRFADVTIGLACCILGGWLERYPGLRLIGQGAGGALALLTEKLDRAWSPEHWQVGADRRPLSTNPSLPRPPSSYLNGIWVDTATPSTAAVELAVRVFGPDKILYGSDSPPLPGSSVDEGLRLVEHLDISDTDRQAIRETNARVLFKSALPDAVPTGA